MTRNTARFLAFFVASILVSVPQVLATDGAPAPPPAADEPVAAVEIPVADAVPVAEQDAEPDTVSQDYLGTSFLTFLANAGAQVSASCIFCSSSSQCQPICGGVPGFDFACIYDFDCEHRTCVCL